MEVRVEFKVTSPAIPPLLRYICKDEENAVSLGNPLQEVYQDSGHLGNTVNNCVLRTVAPKHLWVLIALL